MASSSSCLIFSLSLSLPPVPPTPKRAPEEGPEALLGLTSLPLPLLPGVAMQTPVPSCSPAAGCSPGAGITGGSR